MRLGWLEVAALAAAAVVDAQDLAYSPPFYPSPWMDGKGEWADSYHRAVEFVSQLTLAEKVNLTTGVGWSQDVCVGNTGAIPRLGFWGFCAQDSPLGVRLSDYNTAFPAGVNVAATWDKSLAYLRGQGMGAEHRDKGVDVQLGPVAGPLGSFPEGGRNWEGFAPDPVLTGKMIAETIKGIQSQNVIACAKHYILNEQEHFRQAPEAQNYGYNITESVSSNIDDKTMHEVYLWPFADAVRAGVGSIMCSYNQINNSYGCANSHTLNKLLKGELNFQGFVMSDWSAQHSGVSSTLAGLDMTMPGDVGFDSGTSYFGTNLTIAVLNGTVPEWRIDDAAVRIMSAFYKVGRDKVRTPPNFSSWTRDVYGFVHAAVDQEYALVNQRVDVRANHRDIVRKVGAASTVLLKNSCGALPLTGKEKFVGIMGEDAAPNPWGANGCGDRGCDNGTLAMGWGSGTANFPYLISPEEAIRREVIDKGGEVFAVTDNGALDQMASTASQASVSLVFVNADSGEGYINVDGNEGDRKNLTLWKSGDEIIKTVASNCNNTIVVMHTVGPVLVTDWYENPNITAILWAGLPGEQSGNSLVDVLYGQVNPSGKTPFTWGKSYDSWGAHVMTQPNNGHGAPQEDFSWGSFIDYRYFDKKNETPVWEFGYGLSYTSFEYANLEVTPVGAGHYTPASGQTQPAPTFGQPGNASQYLFPSGVQRVPEFIYPFLNSTDLKKSANDPDYGMSTSSYIPAGATDGSAQKLLPASGAPGGNPGLYDDLFKVTATITNTGKVAGAEVPQLYVSLGGPDDPKVVLRDFDRVHIDPGKSVKWSTTLTRRDISNWDVTADNWVISQYPKTVYVGSSSRQLHLQAPLPQVNNCS